MIAANTSVRPSVGRLVMKWPPHCLQNSRSLVSVLRKWPTNSAPLVTLTLSGFHNMNAFTGPADQERQELQ